MDEENTLAYYDTATIRAVEGFIVGVSVGQIFFVSHFNKTSFSLCLEMLIKLFLWPVL
jgi:hypothetical protein